VQCETAFFIILPSLTKRKGNYQIAQLQGKKALYFGEPLLAILHDIGIVYVEWSNMILS